MLATKQQNMTNEQINREFFIRRDPSYNGSCNNTLLSAATFKAEIGEDLAMKFIKKAVQKGKDKLTCKLRRGVKFEIVSK